MASIKALSLILLSAITGGQAMAQPVAKTVVAEHFTNTYCSVCAMNNPPFYSNLSGFPQVLHIAYHPSSPYPACPLSMHNVAGNNARAHYYGLFGPTPRVVMQGVNVVSGTFANPAIFTSVSGQTTSFSMKVTATLYGADSIETSVTIKKTDASSLSTLSLYGALVEDTLFFTAANGETGSYDVFRKAVWNDTSMSITAPSGIGDSVVLTRRTAHSPVWNKTRIYALAMLQDGAKNIVQAARSANLPPSAGITTPAGTAAFTVFPNPAGESIKVQGNFQYPCRYEIYSIAGKRVRSAMLNSPNTIIDVSGLATGEYFLKTENGGAGISAKFVKN